MQFTLIKPALAALCLALLGTGAHAGESNHLPQSLKDPVLGLRLPANATLDLMPEDIRAKCEAIADSEAWTGRIWNFGMVKHPSATYYLANGYFKRRDRQADERLYFQPDYGGVYRITSDRCDGDQAEETFDVRDPEQIPPAVLKDLAKDLAARLVRAMGGEERLRAEIAKQRLDFHMLSPELQEAFKPYFPPVK